MPHTLHGQSRTERSTRLVVSALLAVIVAMMLSLGIGAATANASPELESASPAPSAGGFNFSGIIRDGQTPLPGVAITVTGEGFEQTATTAEDGRWIVTVPTAGTYTVTLDLTTLPEGLELRDPSFESREYEVGNTTTIGVLFPFGEPVASTDPSAGPSGGSGSESGSDNAPTFLEQLYQRTVTGLNFGLLLALAAIGITLIFGTTGVNNFAHGEMLTLGGFAFFLFTSIWPVWLAVIATLIVSGAVGWLHDAAIFKPLRRRRVGLVQVLIVTIGLSIALRYFFQFLFGGGSQGLAVDNSARIDMGSFNLSVSNIVAMIVAVVVLVLVGLFLTRTRLGKATRAVSDNPSLAAASGINVDRVIRIVWVLAGVLTGLAGLLYTYFIGANIRWDTGFSILLLMFAAVTLGGLGSAFGALVGALIIGLATQISTLWIPSDLRYAVALVILILVLLLRPQGVLGRKERIG